MTTGLVGRLCFAPEPIVASLAGARQLDVSAVRQTPPPPQCWINRTESAASFTGAALVRYEMQLNQSTVTTRSNNSPPRWGSATHEPFTSAGSCESHLA